MPQAQFLNIPNIGGALGQFGAGVLGEYAQNKQQQREENALETAINAAQKSKDPLMEILKSKGLTTEKKTKLADIFLAREKNRASTDMANAKYQQKEEDLSLKRQKLNADIARLDQKEKIEYGKKAAPFEVALNTLDRMNEIRSRKRLGLPARVLGRFPASETRRDMAAYKADAKSLIGLVATIPVRNRPEFETYKEQLDDPYLSDKDWEGVYQEMKAKFLNELDYLSKTYNKSESKNESKKERPPLSSFEVK